MLKKAANQFQSNSTVHAALSVAIYKEKCVQDAMNKLLDAKKEAANSWMKWAKLEDNVPVQELFLKMGEIDYLWIRTYRDYVNQLESYKEPFKEILQGDKMVDDLKKKVNEMPPKLEKLSKTINKMTVDSKRDERKIEEKTLEYGKMMSMYQQGVEELKDKEANNQLFKYKKVQDAIKLDNDATTTFHERGFEIAQTQRLLLDFYTATTYGSVTEHVMKTAKQNGATLLNELEEKLKIEARASMPNFMTSEHFTPSTSEDTLISFNEEENAEYTAVPDMEDFDEDAALNPPHRRAVQAGNVPSSRPLPAAPAEYNNAQPQRYPYASAPEISPTNSLLRQQVPAKQTPSSHQGQPHRRKAPKPPAAVWPTIPARRPQSNTESAYLEMYNPREGGMRHNSLYEGNDDNRSSAYGNLADAYSDKLSIDPRRQGSLNSDSGLSHGGSSKSTSSQQHELVDDYGDLIYDTVGGENETHMRLGDVKRSTPNPNQEIYEL